jgi:hypothetical protein
MVGSLELRAISETNISINDAGYIYDQVNGIRIKVCQITKFTPPR